MAELTFERRYQLDAMAIEILSGVDRDKLLLTLPPDDVQYVDGQADTIWSACLAFARVTGTDAQQVLAAVKELQLSSSRIAAIIARSRS